MTNERLTYATRKSALALAQSRALVAELGLAHPELTITELTVTTTGDKIQDRSLTEIGGKGLFVKEIEEALIAREADIAVHSLKDVPGEIAPGLRIGCVPKREDPRDVIVSRSGAKLMELPAGAKLGTTSLRRQLQLRVLRPDLVLVPLRGNVDTRIRKCRDGEVDAVVLARAGLLRLGRADETTEVLEAEVSLPAVGQGALAVELRIDDERTDALLEPLRDVTTSRAVAAERGVLMAVQGGCQTPMAAYAIEKYGGLWLRAFLAEPDGSRVRRGERRVPFPATDAEAEAIGRELGAELANA
jgi:hydroxymethylbilane synthase